MNTNINYTPAPVPKNSFDPQLCRWPISDTELERRWKQIREVMKQQNIDCLIAQNDHPYRCGMIRYIADVGFISNPVSVLFPQSGEMTILVHGGGPIAPGIPFWSLRGVQDVIGVPTLPTFNNAVNTQDAYVAVDLIKKRGYQKVGLLRPNSMLGLFHHRLLQGLEGCVEVCDITDEIDKIKAVKSEEELLYVQKCAVMADAVMQALPSFIRPGVYEYEIKNYLTQTAANLGSLDQLVFVGSAPAEKRGGNKQHFYQNRRVEKGDQVFVMLEANGPGGYWTELARTYVLGKAPKELKRVWDDAIQAQKYLAALLQPGTSCADVYCQYDEIVLKLGYQSDTRIPSHSQGYDLMERPGIRPDETMDIEKNMNIAVHPTFGSETGWVFASDNYITQADGPATLIHKYPQEIIEIGC